MSPKTQQNSESDIKKQHTSLEAAQDHFAQLPWLYSTTRAAA